MALFKPTRANGLLALIVVLLAALTALQYGLIAELSGYQRQQMERTLRGSTARFVDQLDGELERLWYAFHVRRGRAAGEEIAQDHAEWAGSFDVPELVAEAYWVRQLSGLRGVDVEPTESLGISRIDLSSGRLEPTEWPSELVTLQEPLRESAGRHRGREFHESDSFTATLNDDRTAFVVAQTQLDTKSWAVAVLRRDMLVEQFLPTLVSDHFGADHERDYEVRVFDEAEDGRVLFSSAMADSTDPAAMPEPDVVRHLRSFGGSLQEHEGRFGRDTGNRTLAVAVTHRAGSVDSAVAQLRARNLAFSFGVVLVLGASVGVLAVASRRARRLAERQMEFVAGVSHELRTPIAGISSLSQNLADGVVQDIEHAARYGETIHKESRRLANMVEGVLHFSAVRSGRYRYEMRELDVEDVVETALKTLDPAALQKSSISVDVQKNLPPLRGDERGLQSVIGNLVSNAIKFSPEGGEIRLSVAAVERNDDVEIEFRVDDSGAGIEAAELAHVFEPFFRGHKAQTEQVQGTGLGLSLVREVVEAHGGRVEVSSEPGNGSSFRVYVPAAHVAGAPVADARSATADGLRPAGSEGGAP